MLLIDHFLSDSRDTSNSNKKKKAVSKNIKSNPKVNDDKSKNVRFCGKNSMKCTDFTEKNIKKEHLSLYDGQNNENISPSTSKTSFVPITYENSKNNNNSNNDDSISSSSGILDYDFTTNSVEPKLQLKLLSGIVDDFSNRSDSATLEPEIRECDTSAIIDEIEDMDNDVKAPKLMIGGVIDRFFSVNTEMSAKENNISAHCKLCDHHPLVRGSKKATSNFNRHMVVCFFKFSFELFILC